MAGGAVPNLHLSNGIQVNQAQSIMRFLAKALGYYPDDIQVSLKHDVLCENYSETFEKAIAYMLHPEEDIEAQKDESFVQAAKTIAHCEKVL